MRILRLCCLALVSLVLCQHSVNAQEKSEWKSLFNGKDLQGWDTWLGRPFQKKEVVGLNKDPQNVYTIVTVDGQPAIRISGEIFGALTTKDEFENYHFKLQFKWGDKKWPPRDKKTTPRDSGLLYHCVGKQGAQGSFWMKSQELQIQENDCCDYWSVAGAIVDVLGKKKGNTIFYDEKGEKFTVPSKGLGNRIVRKQGKYEKAHGEWNTIELYCVGGTSVHIVNGEPLMVLKNSRQKVDGKEVPLIRGKLQIQSEGAEVFYRGMMIRSIDAIPEKYLR